MYTSKLKLFILGLAAFGCSQGPSTETDTTAEEPAKKDTVAAETTPPPPDTVLGIDVSHFQGNINWQEIKAARITFAYDKATQGTSYKDPDYQQNRQGAQEAGLRHGGYHFYVAGDDPLKQAENFLATVNYAPGSMPPVLDLEQGGVTGTVNKSTFQQNVLKWLQTVEAKLNVKPVIYTNHPFGNEYLTDPVFAGYDLWIAEYEVAQPKIPTVWNDKGWLIWQRTERGKIEGAVGDVDHDLYNPSQNFAQADKQ